jgi:iron complex transport system ATP-binding protein
MSYLPQSLPTNTALTVFEIVLLGLVDSLSLRVRDDQLEQVMDTLSYLGIEPLATTRLNNLSGGQQQMVSLAQALVKNPQALLLDEPLNSLDIRRQFEILNKIREITYLSPRIVIIAMHDLNLAAKYADSVLALHHGKIYAHGTPENALTEPMIRDLYGMRSEVTLKDGRIPHIRLLDVIEQEPDMPVGFGGR